MKSQLTLILIAISINSMSGQLTKKSDLDRIKNSKTIVITSNDSKKNQFLFDAAKQFWTLSEIVDSMSYDKALEMVKKDKSYILLNLGTSYAISMPEEGPIIGNWQYIYKTMRTGLTIQLMGKNKYKPVTRVHIPGFDNGDSITREIVYFGVAQLESMLRSMEEKNLKSNLSMREMYNDNNAKDLKDKTLLIPAGWIEENLTSEAIKEAYPFPCQIVSYEDWRESIINRKSGYVYGIICPLPSAQSWIYPIYLMDCATGRVKTMYCPFTTGIMGVSRVGSNSAYFTRLALENLARIIKNDIDNL